MIVLGAFIRTAGRPGKERTIQDRASLRDAPPVNSRQLLELGIYHEDIK
jgi:hypothetical protein